MGNLSGKVGVNNAGWVSGSLELNPRQQSFKDKVDALAAARKQTGSELVYEQDGKWHVGQVEQVENMLITESRSQLSREDAADIQLDKGRLAQSGVAQAEISFIEEDQSYELMKLADDPSWNVKYQLAQRKDMPPEVYDKLAQYNSSNMQAMLVRNPATPLSALRHIAENGYSTAQKGLAINPATRKDPQIRAALLDSRSSDVRRLMAMSDGEVQKLSQKFQHHVDNYEKYGALYDLANDPSSSVRSTLAQRTDLPAAIYMELSDDPSSSVRAEVARNPHASLGALRQLANDPSSSVRLEVARHPLAQRDSVMARQLANDPSSSVRSAFAEGPLFKLPYPFVPGGVDPFSGAVQGGVGNTQHTQTQNSAIHQGDNINIQGSHNNIYIKKD